eukprot:1941203-Lingulodinium_polyedra.AAC.1
MCKQLTGANGNSQQNNTLNHSQNLMQVTAPGVELTQDVAIGHHDLLAHGLHFAQLHLALRQLEGGLHTACPCQQM